MQSTLKGTKVNVGDRVVYITPTTFGEAIISNITDKGRIRVHGYLFDTNGKGLGKGSKVFIEPLKTNRSRELQHAIQQYVNAVQEHLSIASIALSKLAECITHQ